MSQLDAELRRFFARRIVRGTALMIVLVAFVSITIVTVRGHPARAGQGFASSVPATIINEPNGRQTFVYGEGLTQSRDTRIDVGHSLEGTLRAMAIVMLFVGVVLGASFVGADYNVGSLTSQLLFESRRWRVHLAKAACVAAGCAAVAAVVCIAIAGMMYAGSEARGIVHGIDSTWLRHRGVDLGRVVTTAAAAGVMAYSFTLVARRTSAAVVVFLVQFPLVGISTSTPVFGLIARLASFRGLLAITTDVRNSASIDLGFLTNAGGLAFTAAWVVVLVVLSGLVFARSEIR